MIENIKETQKEYYENTKEKIKESRKEYYEKNKEKIKENVKEYRIKSKETNIEKYKEKHREYQKSYYEKNKEKINEKFKEIKKENKNDYQKANKKEKLKEYQKEYQKKYRKNNKKVYQKEYSKNYNAEYRRNRRNTDNIYKLKSNIRVLIVNSFRNNSYKKSLKTEIILGCTLEEFRIYLESKFESWMNWENYGKCNGEFNYGWDIDHIIPLVSAKTEEEIIRLNHYTNLQPLCSYINRDVKKDNLYFYN